MKTTDNEKAAARERVTRDAIELANDLREQLMVAVDYANDKSAPRRLELRLPTNLDNTSLKLGLAMVVRNLEEQDNWEQTMELARIIEETMINYMQQRGGEDDPD